MCNQPPAHVLRLCDCRNGQSVLVLNRQLISTVAFSIIFMDVTFCKQYLRDSTLAQGVSCCHPFLSGCRRQELFGRCGRRANCRAVPMRTAAKKTEEHYVAVAFRRGQTLGFEDSVACWPFTAMALLVDEYLFVNEFKLVLLTTKLLCRSRPSFSWSRL